MGKENGPEKALFMCPVCFNPFSARALHEHIAENHLSHRCLQIAYCPKKECKKKRNIYSVSYLTEHLCHKTCNGTCNLIYPQKDCVHRSNCQILLDKLMNFSYQVLGPVTRELESIYHDPLQENRIKRCRQHPPYQQYMQGNATPACFVKDHLAIPNANRNSGLGLGKLSLFKNKVSMFVVARRLEAGVPDTVGEVGAQDTVVVGAPAMEMEAGVPAMEMEAGVPDTVMEAGVPDTVMEAGVPDTVMEAGAQDMAEEAEAPDTVDGIGAPATESVAGAQDMAEEAEAPDTVVVGAPATEMEAGAPATERVAGAQDMSEEVGAPATVVEVGVLDTAEAIGVPETIISRSTVPRSQNSQQEGSTLTVKNELNDSSPAVEISLTNHSRQNVLNDYNPPQISGSNLGNLSGQTGSSSRLERGPPIPWYTGSSYSGYNNSGSNSSRIPVSPRRESMDSLLKSFQDTRAVSDLCYRSCVDTYLLMSGRHRSRSRSRSRSPRRDSRYDRRDDRRDNRYDDRRDDRGYGGRGGDRNGRDSYGGGRGGGGDRNGYGGGRGGGGEYRRDDDRGYGGRGGGGYGGGGGRDGGNDCIERADQFSKEKRLNRTPSRSPMRQRPKSEDQEIVKPLFNTVEIGKGLPPSGGAPGGGGYGGGGGGYGGGGRGGYSGGGRGGYGGDRGGRGGK
ncbi:hypothetical protein PRIPAC_81416 [Pristionchus pacificus]|uniref:Uncharacterized protein n=1 Tax=Pristionchus pacificus TaxID=54126 RepID=A0A2A6C323_PRIPA|nr:hypothetical protein PRIPAC_81416 [Pristionchus pacificus]|eukprot:PDM72519.1 hypothetical protein PRIPAC_38953 [Pristionchus pacificus]